MCLQRKRCVKVVSYSPLTYVCLCTQLLESPSWAMAGSHTYKTFPPCCHRDSVTTFKVTVQVCLHKLLRKGKLRYSHQHTTKRAQPPSHCFPSPPTIKGHAQHFTPLFQSSHSTEATARTQSDMKSCHLELWKSLKNLLRTLLMSLSPCSQSNGSIHLSQILSLTPNSRKTEL